MTLHNLCEWTAENARYSDHRSLTTIQMCAVWILVIGKVTCLKSLLTQWWGQVFKLWDWKTFSGNFLFGLHFLFTFILTEFGNTTLVEDTRRLEANLWIPLPTLYLIPFSYGKLVTSMNDGTSLKSVWNTRSIILPWVKQVKFNQVLSNWRYYFSKLEKLKNSQIQRLVRILTLVLKILVRKTFFIESYFKF